MARRGQYDDDNPLLRFILLCSLLYILYLAYLWYRNRPAFWSWAVYGPAAIGLVVVGIYVWRTFTTRRDMSRRAALLKYVKEAGLEKYIKNFIARFGMQRGKRGDWTFRAYSFDWDRLRDFRKVLGEKGMHLTDDKWGQEISLILHHYVQQEEEEVTRESMNLAPQKFTTLSGAEFETLLYRLFQAMGYAVQKTGKTGDQGGDLVANLNGERIVIQAKRYDRPVGNAAVQEAVAAQKLYDCSRAMVVSTSSFTPEAIQLAKVNNVELIGGRKLSEMLLQYRKESWS